MAKKQKTEIIAHYLVPTYNLYGNVAMAHVIKAKYNGQDVDINVWLAKVLLGDEQRSLNLSFVQQRLLCEVQYGLLKNRFQRAMVNKSIKTLDNIIMMNKTPGFECVADDKLKSVLIKYLDELNAVYNLDCAKLVAGIMK